MGKSRFTLSRFGLIFFNFILLAFGISFIVAGTFVDKTNKNITDKVFPDSPVADILFTLVLQAGAVITIFAFTGWYGAVSGHRLLLSLYLGFLMALMICGVAALCLTIGYKQKLIDYILKTTDSKFENYKIDSDATAAVNFIQRFWKCWGTANNTTPRINLKETPESCYSPNTTKLYTTGCNSPMIESFHNRLPTFIWTSVAVEVVEIGALVCSVKVMAILE